MNRLIKRHVANALRYLAWRLLRRAQRIDGAYLNPVWYVQKNKGLFFDRDGERCGWVATQEPSE